MATKVSNTTPLFGNRRSPALNSTRHAFKPNYQKVKLDNGNEIIVRDSIIGDEDAILKDISIYKGKGYKILNS